MTKHYTIPFFIPHKGCPHQCIFCNQNSITGEKTMSPRDVSVRVEEYLKSIPAGNREIEIGFFGGTFTGLDKSAQQSFLLSVRKYIVPGKVSGVRISTRPDYINKNILNFLKENNVKCIELGVQSMSDDVLKASKRGHTPDDVKRASEMIVKAGFILGHQMMLGLPLSTLEDEVYTAKMVKVLGATQVRIYPVVVMKDTLLAEKWKKKEYSPLTEKEAVDRAAQIVLYFNANDIKVIRCGLHPSEDLLSGKGILSGPFHTAFGLKVESRIFLSMLRYINNNCMLVVKDDLKICYNPKDEAAFFGFKRENQPTINIICVKDNLRKGEDVPRGTVRLGFGKRTLLVDRKTVVENL
ncbi:MAG: radical SAM protein [Candidatus Omnitrophica bacterium]|nr:radical SAM protein [Candidatus Omnitrophota bacterium]